MRKVKQIALLQTKERLKQQKTISQLVKVNSEVEKCSKISKNLQEIAQDKAREEDVINSYSFQSNRQLIQKLMEQREILLNRQEFLEQEKMAVSAELSNSKSKNDVLEKKRVKEKIAGAAKKENKMDENHYLNNRR